MDTQTSITAALFSYPGLKMDSLEYGFPHTARMWTHSHMAVSKGPSLRASDASWENEFFWRLSSGGRTHKGGNAPLIGRGSKNSGHVHTKPCMWMFTSIFICDSPNVETARLPSPGEWLTNCDPSVLRRSNYSAVKGMERSIHTTTWMDPQGLTPRERSQSQKVAYCVIPFIEHFKMANFRNGD